MGSVHESLNPRTVRFSRHLCPGVVLPDDELGSAARYLGDPPDNLFLESKFDF